MSSFRSLGVGSGLDLETLVAGLLRAERQPREAQLNRLGSVASTRLSAFGTLKSALVGLTTALRALQESGIGFTATSSDATRVAARATEGANVGSFQLTVSQLASAQSLASAAFADADAPLGTGELTVSVGGESVTLALDATNSSLDQISSALNASGLGLQSVVVRDGEQYRLLLTSGQTGTAGEMTLTAGAGVDGRLASAAMDETVAAADALLTVNGLALSSSSNEIDDVVPGVALTLLGLTEGSQAVTVTVAVDRAGLRGRLDGLVNAYNTLVDNVRSAGRADPEGGNSGPLVGDATLRAIQSRLSGAFSRRVDTGGESGGFATMLDIGLSTGLDGRASLDAERLAAAIDQDRAGVEALTSAFAAGLADALDAFAGSGGVLDTRRDALTAELRRVGEQREALERRLEQIETRLRTQFSALDSLLARFQNTSTYLTQQLANLSNLTLGNDR